MFFHSQYNKSEQGLLYNAVIKCNKFLFKALSVKPWPNGPASGRKLNLRRDLRLVAKRTRKLPHKYTQVRKETF